MSTRCPSCETEGVSVESRVEPFVYGAGADRVTLSAEYPVYTCAWCGLEYSDEIGEDARTRAVEGHLAKAVAE